MGAATNTIFHRLPALGAVVAALSVPSAAAAAPRAPLTPEQLDAAGVHEIIVKHAAGLDPGEREQVRAGADVTFQRSLRLPDTEVVKADPGRLQAALDALRADPSVVYAEPDAPVRALTQDPYWTDQWALQNTGEAPSYLGAVPGQAGDDIDAPGAWAQGTAGGGQVVAVVDSGVFAAHPDLAGQMAPSPAGKDWVDGDSNPDDEDGHGTHVAGIIAAAQNNGVGISGVAPRARLVSLRVLDANGSGFDSDVASAFDYAGDNGVPIVNASLDSPVQSETVSAAISAHPATLYVVAAGNDGTDDDTVRKWPCSEPEPNVICVGATDGSDNPADFSNYGHASVDLFAPGVGILSSWLPSAGVCSWLCFLDGTSMATPHVAGTLALMRAAAPSLTAAQLKQALLASVDPVPLLEPKSVSGGRLNAAKAVAEARRLAALDNPPPVPTAPAAPLATPPPAPAPTAPVTTATTPAAPVLGGLTTTGGARTVRVCRASAHGCRATAMTVTFRLDRAAKVTAQVQRRDCKGGHCRYVTAATVRATAKPGANKLTIGARGATAKLKAGAYRLRVVASVSGTASGARTIAFRVR